MRTLLNRLGQALVVLAFLLFGSPARADEWRASADDSQLFDVRLNQYRLGDGVRGYLTPTGTCVDLADTIMALDIAVRIDKESRRATGWAYFEEQTISIDRTSGQEQIGNLKRKVAPDDIRDTPEGWCVSVDALSRWLGLKLVADSSNALLIINSDRKLPPQLAAERRARIARMPVSFDLASLPKAQSPMRGVKPPAIDIVAAATVFQDKVEGNRIDLPYEVFAAGEMGPVSYDARLSSNRRGVPANLRMRAYRTDPAGGLPLGATHMAIGDVAGFATPLVAQSGVGRGATITNRPIDRPLQFDKTDFRGNLPNGWDVELYRNGLLLAFANDRADGRYEFLDIPLQYGQNRFEVVLYGPQGQVRREARNMPVGIDSIPPRKTFWWAGIEEEGRDLIGLSGATATQRTGWRGTIGMERGIDTQTSFALTAHSLGFDQIGRRNFGEVALRRAFGPLLGEFSATMDDDGRTAFRAHGLGQLGATNIGFETIWAQGGFESDRVLRGVTGQHSLTLDHFFGNGGGGIPVHMGAQLLTRADGSSLLETDTRASLSFGRMAITGELIWRNERRPYGPEPDDVIEAGLLANARIGPVRLRGEARWQLGGNPGFEKATLVGEWNAGGNAFHQADWRAEIGYDRTAGRGHVGLGYIRRFDRLALSLNGTAGTDGSLSAGVSLAFSLGPDPRLDGGVRMTSQKLAQNGTALVRIWRDTNNNGIRDPGELPEKGVQVTAGRAPVEQMTDANGEVIVDGLDPFRAVMVGVDGSSLPDPFVQPSLPGVVLTPRPGIIATIELPLVGTGEIDGTLVRSGGGELGGLHLELVDSAGRVIARTTSEFDGFFLFEQVPYGRYSLRVAKLAADAADLNSALARDLLVADGAPSVHVGTLAISPKAILQAELDGSTLAGQPVAQDASIGAASDLSLPEAAPPSDAPAMDAPAADGPAAPLPVLKPAPNPSFPSKAPSVSSQTHKAALDPATGSASPVHNSTASTVDRPGQPDRVGAPLRFMPKHRRSVAPMTMASGRDSRATMRLTVGRKLYSCGCACKTQRCVKARKTYRALQLRFGARYPQLFANHRTYCRCQSQKRFMSRAARAWCQRLINAHHRRFDKRRTISR